MAGVVRRGRLVPLFVVVLVAGVLSVAAAGPAVAQTQSRTFAQVQCTAVVNGSTISQSQDVSVSITAPDSVVPNSSFTITFPGGTAMLPTQSNGLTITSYSNIFLTYQMHSAPFTNNTIVNPGTATLIPAGSTTPQTIVQQATLPTSDQIKSGEPGPFSPGTPGPNNQATLITPDISVNAVAPASGSITLNALTLTTTVVLNGSITANVTCNIPHDTIITIPVRNPNTPPTVNAGPDVSGSTGTPIALSGSVTDPDSTPTDAWTVNDPACTFTAPSSPSTSVSCSKPGTFTATLTANDGVNPAVSDTAQVTVTQTVPLVVSAGGPVSGAVSHQIALHGTVSDPGNTPISAWTVNSPSCTFANASAPDTTISCSTTGTFTATLSAHDAVNSKSDTATVTVNPDMPPTVNAGPDVSGNTATPIALSGTVADPDDTPTVHWTASDPRCSFADASKASTSITCSAPGTYTATLTANDGFNPAVSDSASVVVTDILFPFNYVVDATTHLKTLNQDVTVPQGTFTGVIDITTGVLQGDIALPPAEFTFNLAGVGLVTADMQIAETQHVTGTLDVASLAVSATAVFDINITSLHPTATPTVNLVGNSCKTSTPVSVTMGGTANLTGASTFSGTYTIPPLQNCGLLTTALNLVIPGPGNTFTAVAQPPPAPPAIDSQPSDTMVGPGQSYSFSADATGYPTPTVQWQVSTNRGSSFADISGATGSSYSGTAALADSGKQFRAVFTNASGTATSDAATLTVAVPPDAPTIGTATAGPSSAIVAFTGPVHDGGTQVIDYTASCTTTDGGVNGSATGASSPLTVSGLTPGAIYTCTVTARNAMGSSAPSGASNQVVPTAPPSITAQPSNQSVNVGQTYSFSAAASGSPGPTTQWQVSTNGGSTFTNVAGATANTLSGTAAIADSGKQFRAVFTNSTGTATTNAATLTVISVAPQITTQPTDQTAVPGQSYSFSAAASGAPTPTVQWQVSADGGSTFTNVSGATADTLTGTAAASDSGKQFRAVYTNAAGTATTNTAELAVNVPSTISIGNTSVMEGNTLKNRTATLTVALSKASTSTVTVHYTTSGGTATPTTDYVTKAATLTFTPGQTVKYITVAVKPDTTGEPDETIQVPLSLATGGYTLAPAHATGIITILNDDPSSSGLTVSIGDVTVCRAYSGPVNLAQFLVSLSAPATTTVTVKLALSSGTAISGVDYKPWAVKTLTFQAGAFQKVVTVSVIPGSSAQSKTALLTLSGPSAGLTVNRAVGTLTIVNHD